MKRLCLLLALVVCLGAFSDLTGFGQKSPFKKSAVPPYPCQTVWTAPGLGVLTPNLVISPLANGYVMYTVRVQLHTPEGNETECGVRQFRFHFPLLKNWMVAGMGDVPTMQITIESGSSVGFGDALVLSSVQRLEENGFSGFVMDADTPAGYQSPSVYFANVTVIGRPKKQ